MDPLSATASAIAIIGLLGQSCQFVSRFLGGISDASASIRARHTTLQALSASLRKIQALYAENSQITEPAPEFAAQVADCMTDFVTIEAKLRKAIEGLNKGRCTRRLAKLKWSISSEDWLKRFLTRVQRYHAVMSLELMTLQMSLPIRPSFLPRETDRDLVKQIWSIPNLSHILEPSKPSAIGNYWMHPPSKIFCRRR